MSHKTPQTIHDAAAAFDSLPGVGPRAALRYAYWLVTQPRETLKQFAAAIAALADGVRRCRLCGLWTEQELCGVCGNPKRDRSTVCVVATNQDAQVIEDSGAFTGVYHVLGGLLDPIEGQTAETLAIPALLRRLSDQTAPVREVIMAFDPDVRGDTTALYLSKQLSKFPVTISRLARGLPTGAQLEYADEATVADALENRKKTDQKENPGA